MCTIHNTYRTGGEGVNRRLVGGGGYFVTECIPTAKSSNTTKIAHTPFLLYI